jgi:hypothetical protein
VWQNISEDPVSEYVCGGYYLARPSERAGSYSPELIPDKVLSASGCLSDFFPDVWAIEWSSESAETRSKQAAAFGADLPAVVVWATRSFQKTFGWPNAFYTLAAAREARAKFLPGDSDAVIFGLGLRDTDVEAFLHQAKPKPPDPAYAPQGETGVYECVRAGNKIAEGDAAGFELMSTSMGLLNCSWLCNGLEKTCATKLGIAPNPQGFVQSYDDASRCAELISRKETGAEPGLWLPWLVTIYRPDASSSTA